MTLRERLARALRRLLARALERVGAYEYRLRKRRLATTRFVWPCPPPPDEVDDGAHEEMEREARLGDRA